MADILNEIILNKKKELALTKQKLPIEKIKNKLEKTNRDFFTALKGKNNIIAEIKYKSPSAGKIGKKRTIKEIVQAYDKYANAISILTDKKYFAGELKYIKEAKKYTQLPILRKDFIIDEYQVYESRYYDADAILLIASIFGKEEIEKMLTIARSLGMEALVETKTKEEIEKVLKTSTKIIGINNRNLSNFEISLNTTKELKKLIPPDKIIVSESGIHTKKDILELNTNAVLIGTALMAEKNIAEKLSEMHRTKVKICGITNKEDAQEAVQAGADILGFNFYKKSPRNITPAHAKEIIKTLPNTMQTAGVFVNSPKKEIKKIEQETGIDLLQIHGDESEEFCATLGTNAIKAVRVKGKIPKNKKTLYARIYDAFDPKAYGGTGKQFNPKKLSKTEGKIILAGGLKPENIPGTLNNLHPYCVDACSGVESTPGKKDKEKMKKLIATVQENETLETIKKT